MELNTVCFQFIFQDNEANGEPSFSIDDGSQVPLQLSSSDRNIIAATFTQFLLKNIG